MRVVLSYDYVGPGSGLDGSEPELAASSPDVGTFQINSAPAPSPIITAGSDDPKCVN